MSIIYEVDCSYVVKLSQFIKMMCVHWLLLSFGCKLVISTCSKPDTHYGQSLCTKKQSDQLMKTFIKKKMNATFV